MRREATQDDIVFKTKLQDFEGLVYPETVTNQDPRSLASLFSGLGIEDALKLLQANLRVRIPRFRAGVVPSGYRERSPVTSIDSSWPNNH